MALSPCLCRASPRSHGARMQYQMSGLSYDRPPGPAHVTLGPESVLATILPPKGAAHRWDWQSPLQDLRRDLTGVSQPSRERPVGRISSRRGRPVRAAQQSTVDHTQSSLTGVTSASSLAPRRPAGRPARSCSRHSCARLAPPCPETGVQTIWRGTFSTRADREFGVGRRAVRERDQLLGVGAEHRVDRPREPLVQLLRLGSNHEPLAISSFRTLDASSRPMTLGNGRPHEAQTRRGTPKHRRCLGPDQCHLRAPARRQALAARSPMLLHDFSQGRTGARSLDALRHLPSPLRSCRRR